MKLSATVLLYGLVAAAHAAATYPLFEFHALLHALLAATPGSNPPRASQSRRLQQAPFRPTLVFTYNPAPVNATSTRDDACLRHTRTEPPACAHGFTKRCLADLAAHWGVPEAQLFHSHHLELGSIHLPANVTRTELKQIILDVACNPFIKSVTPDAPLTLHGYKHYDGSAHLRRLGKPVNPNDPFFSRQWHLDAMNLPEAWAISKGDNGILVMVIDTGVDSTHPDLNENVWSDPTNPSVRGFNTANEMGTSEDDNGHGTHCAGNIGAVTNNKIGVAGINWAPKILPCKMLENGAGQVSNAAKCMDIAVEHKVKVVSASWGGDQTVPALEQGIQKLGQNQITFVTASGNNARDIDVQPSYPASYQLSNMIVVTGVKENDDMLDDANWGPQSVHLGAPGDLIYSTVKDNGYALYGGTSMAAPAVAGLIALCLSKNANLTPTDMIWRLMQSMIPSAQLTGKTKWGGTPDASKFLQSC